MVPVGSKMVKIERVLHTSNEPFALETCYLPAERVPGLVRGRWEELRYLRVLRRTTGYN